MKSWALLPEPEYNILINSLIFIFTGLLYSQSANIPETYVSDKRDLQNVQYAFSKGEGGTIFWQDSVYSGSKLRYQLIDKNNAPVFGEKGEWLIAGEGNESNPFAFRGTKGSSVILWKSLIKGKNTLYSQRLSQSGKKIWNEKGLVLTDENIDLREYCGLTGLEGKSYIISSYTYQESDRIGYAVSLHRITPSGYQSTLVNGRNLYFSANAIRQVSAALNKENYLMVSWLENIGGRELLRSIIIDPEDDRSFFYEPITISHSAQKIITYKTESTDNYFYYVWQTIGKKKNLYHEFVNQKGIPLLKTPDSEAVKVPGSNTNPQVVSNGNEIILSWLNEEKKETKLLLTKISGRNLNQKNEYINVFGIRENFNRYGQVLALGENGEIIVSWYEAEKGSRTRSVYMQRFNKNLLPLNQTGAISLSSFGENISYINFTPTTNNRVLALYKERREEGYSINSQTLSGSGAGALFISNFSISAIGDSVIISWAVSDEKDLRLMKVQRYSEDENDAGWVDITQFTPQSFSGQQTFTYGYIPYMLGKIDYRIEIVTKQGEVVTSPVKSTHFTSLLTSDIKLFQNTPNPFSNNTIIPFYLSEAVSVIIEIYNSRIELVREYTITETEEGLNKIEFNGSNLPSGVYFYRFTAGEFKEVRKMVMARE